MTRGSWKASDTVDWNPFLFLEHEQSRNTSRDAGPTMQLETGQHFPVRITERRPLSRPMTLRKCDLDCPSVHCCCCLHGSAAYTDVFCCLAAFCSASYLGICGDFLFRVRCQSQGVCLFCRLLLRIIPANSQWLGAPGSTSSYILSDGHD